MEWRPVSPPAGASAEAPEGRTKEQVGKGITETMGKQLREQCVKQKSVRLLTRTFGAVRDGEKLEKQSGQNWSAVVEAIDEAILGGAFDKACCEAHGKQRVVQLEMQLAKRWVTSC
eukprot:Skav203351  [mRNA]  locus=scaffold1076:293793:294140:+ [translate_table: standard]